MEVSTCNPKTVQEAEALAAQAYAAMNAPIITEQQAAILLQTSVMQMHRLRDQLKLSHLRLGRNSVRYVRETLMKELSNQ